MLVLLSCVLLVVPACQQTGDASLDGDDSVDFDAVMQSRISVSGLSAGAYMAVQTHVALADKIGGVAAVAGGPYHCAEGKVGTALSRCITGEDLIAEPLIAFARDAAAAGDVAPLDALGKARVWIYHSPLDDIVAPVASEILGEFYRAFVPESQITLVDSVASAHGWPTTQQGGPCGEMNADFTNACGFDAAGELLRHLYVDLADAVPADPGNLAEIDVSSFFDSGSKVAATGFAYVPVRCGATDAQCRLHIVFHGCRQGAEFVEDRFASQAGFNEWAESNGIIVVYPQIEKSLLNPQGCWDWWGYTSGDYDLRSGQQISGVGAMIDAFATDLLIN